MKILALETSTETASLALLCDGEARVVTFSTPPAHSATVLPALGRLLADAGLALPQLDVIACGVGPGSFTGVRLACSVVQGLSLGADLPVAPVGSLLALAQEQAAGRVYCALDARMSEIYVAAYEKGPDGWLEQIGPCCVAPDRVPQPKGGSWVAAGTAFLVYPEIAVGLTGCQVLPGMVSVPGAQAIAELATQVTWQDVAQLAPVYVRDRVASTVAERLAAGGKA